MTAADQLPGAHHLTIGLRLAGLAWLAMTLQEILLFGRTTPYGGPYVAEWARYFPYAVAYNLIGVMLVSAPAVVLWLLWRGRPVRGEVARRIHYTLLGLLMLTVALDQIDNEVMRFMGIHLSFNLVRTYFKVNAWGNDMLHIFLTDRGGPGIPFVILLGMQLGLWWAGRRIIQRARALPLLWSWPAAFSVGLGSLLFPICIWYLGPGGEFRKLRTKPAIMTLYDELGEDLAQGTPPDRFESLARDYQQRWFVQSGDTSWRFTDPERPLVRVPLTPAAPVQGKPWNVIYIQLETFRGWNTGFLRPDVSSPTPFLDRFARDSNAAYWRRHLSMGPPTVSGLISGACSVKPHSSQNITTSFAYTALECLPHVLRRHGYRAEHFTGFDPDWDSETAWLREWFDDSHFVKAGGDRTLFRLAASRIRDLGRGPRPFMVMVVSSSNHYPFRIHERQFTLDPENEPTWSIRNTMRYTDDVLGEFIDSLRQEPWYERTLLVITGDHGYNLGEHGPAAQFSGWRESVWVPLVIHGAHPRLPRGGHDEWATLLDIAPTVADLLGMRDSTPWMGSSLLHRRSDAATFALARRTSVFGEQGRFSMVVDPANGKGRVYDAVEDPLQQTDISAAHPDVVAALRRQAKDESKLVDFLLETDRVWQKPTTPCLKDQVSTPSQPCTPQHVVSRH
jgi:sulfatase-like protein